MDARFYNSEDIDLEQLANDLVNVYMSQGYQAQQFGDQRQRLVQLKKGGDFEAIIGMQAALSVTLQKSAGGTLAMIGQQRWLDKAAVGAVGIVALPVLWPLAITAGVGALRQASLGNQVLNMVDGLVRQQRPNLVAGPIPMQLLPQAQQQWGSPPQQQTPFYTPPQQQIPPYIPPPRVVVSEVPPPAPAPPTPPSLSGQLHCPNCNTPYEAGDTFCSGCGRSLAPAKQYCSNCNYEIKPGVSFCPKCGASTFSSAQTQAAPGRPLPPSSPPQPTVTYTRPDTPVYTPPPAQPTTPAYTPPPKPPTPVYTPPSTPVYTPPPQPPTIEAKPAQVTPAPEPPPYVPPVTQEPIVLPQPKVTYTPSTEPKKDKPAPPRPEKQYYIPSSQAQTGTPPGAAQTPPAQQAPRGAVPPPAPAHPLQLNQTPASDTGKPWAKLTFNDGKQIEVTAEHAMVGRYDHDLGGLQPDVDLSDIQGADTVSRVHAALEHVGNSYTLTDLNSTNATRINNKRLEPDKATPVNDGDTLQFGKLTCTFKKV